MHFKVQIWRFEGPLYSTHLMHYLISQDNKILSLLYMLSFWDLFLIYEIVLYALCVISPLLLYWFDCTQDSLKTTAKITLK